MQAGDQTKGNQEKQLAGKIEEERGQLAPYDL